MLRKLFVLAGLALLAAPLPGPAAAQNFPTRPVTLVVPYPPGASTDQIARIVQPGLGRALGQPVVIENRGGGNGNIGAAYVAHGTADGHTVLLTTSAAIAMNPVLYPDIGYNPVRDLVPITNAVRAVIAVAVPNALPVRTMPELIAYLRANPDKATYGTAGAGSPQHVAGQVLGRAIGVNMLHVGYRGGAGAVTDVIGGHVSMAIATLSAFLPQFDAGALRVIAVGEPQRFAGRPEIPTVAETVPGFEATTWLGFFAAARTPQPIVERLNRELVAVLRTPEVQGKLQDLALAVVADSSADFGNTVRTESAFWQRRLPELGIRPE
ncbi:Bug family tripartite tricarboxylate transporter substrate binding protein [Roseomonas sp. BN140053]|uniref:Bug family tripartite tricarboxylate transporter substrate binding protein n=1 Tax=Roseomonas sp. BN140053 TaxID=3391898 RepID=UPI0039E9C83B